MTEKNVENWFEVNIKKESKMRQLPQIEHNGEIWTVDGRLGEIRNSKMVCIPFNDIEDDELFEKLIDNPETNRELLMPI